MTSINLIYFILAGLDDTTAAGLNGTLKIGCSTNTSSEV